MTLIWPRRLTATPGSSVISWFATWESKRRFKARNVGCNRWKLDSLTWKGVFMCVYRVMVCVWPLDLVYVYAEYVMPCLFVCKDACSECVLEMRYVLCKQNSQRNVHTYTYACIYTWCVATFTHNTHPVMTYAYMNRLQCVFIWSLQYIYVYIYSILYIYIQSTGIYVDSVNLVKQYQRWLNNCRCVCMRKIDQTKNEQVYAGTKIKILYVYTKKSVEKTKQTEQFTQFDMGKSTSTLIYMH